MPHANNAIHRFDESAARDYLKSVDPTGALPLAWATKQMSNERWHERPLADSEALIEAVADVDMTAHSVFICPAPRRPGDASRKGGSSHRAQLVWADYDSDKSDRPFPRHVFEPGGELADFALMVESGRKGHRHIYIHLDAAVGPKALQMLNYGLKELIGADVKWPHNSLLRLPGTFNPKTDAMRAVRVVQSPSGQIAPQALLRVLLDHTEPHITKNYLEWATREKSSGRALVDVKIDREALLSRVRPRFARQIRRNQSPTGGYGDESQQLYNFLRDLYKNCDLDEDEAYTLMQTFEPFMTRLGHRADKEVSKVWYEGETTPERKAERDRNMGVGKAKPKGDQPEAKQERSTWTDESNAQFLIKNHGRDFFALTTTDGDPLYMWDGSIWTPDDALARLHTICAAHQATLDDTNEEGQFSQGLHRQGRSAGTRNNMIRLFKVHIGRKAEELDADPTLLHMGTAVYDSKTGQVRKPRRTDLMTKRTRATYDPKATCSRFELHLKRCLPDDEVRGYTRYLLSRVVSGRASKHIPVFVGEPDSGKSAVVGGVAYPLGLYAKRVADDVALLKPGNSHKANLHALRDARLGMVHEPSEGTKFNVDQLKSLSGGDEQTSNAMRSNYETWTPRLQLLVTCNKVPNMGDDAGLQERLKFIKFTQVIPHEDRIEHFAEKVLHPEAAGILNWLIEAHREHLGTAAIDPPAGVVTTREEIARAQNPVYEFIEDQIEAGVLVCEKAGRVEASDRLYKDMYLTWCRSRNRRTEALTVRRFNKGMRDLGFRARASNGRQHWVGLTETVGEI